MNEAFHGGSIGSHFHADTAIGGSTLHFSAGAAADDGESSAKDKDAADPRLTARSVNRSWCFHFWPRLLNGFSRFCPNTRYSSYFTDVIASLFLLGVRQPSVARI